MEQGFQCVLLTPEQQVLERSVTYVSLPAWDGLLGVAAGRAPLLVKLGDGVLRLDAEDESQWYFVGGGFATMRANKLVILAEEAIPAADVNAEQASSTLQETQSQVAVGDEAVAARDRKANRARQMLALAERQ